MNRWLRVSGSNSLRRCLLKGFFCSPEAVAVRLPARWITRAPEASSEPLAARFCFQSPEALVVETPVATQAPEALGERLSARVCSQSPEALVVETLEATRAPEASKEVTKSNSPCNVSVRSLSWFFSTQSKRCASILQ